ncbi:MAG: fatty acid desaturase [Crocinitomicaceae bacterium]|jgi:linoleoyl-CoA desaturase|nr:fatty acid desaturase [Crocinitomicaceae bacterium]
MKARHLQIEEDNNLFSLIQQRIQLELDVKGFSFRFRLWVKFLFYLGLSASLYAILFWSMPSYLFLLCYVLFGWVMLLFAFNFAHDFSHNTVFKKSKWNNLGFIAIYTLVGAHAEAWRERHVNSHHFAPNVMEYDTDLQITGIIRVTPDMTYRWYHRYQFVYACFAYSLYSFYWIFVKDVLMLINKRHKGEADWKYFMSFLLQKIVYVGYLLVVPLLFAEQSIAIVLLGFLLMHFVQSVFLLFTFFMTHHVLETHYPCTDEKGIIQTSWLMNQIRSSNDMHPFSEVANFVLGGFNNHIAHHLFPHIHHLHYPKLNKILYRTLMEEGIIPNQTSYFGGVVSHLKLLRKLGFRPKV